MLKRIVVFSLLVAGVAAADRIVRIRSDKARVVRGDFIPRGDGGYLVGFCAETVDADGKKALVENPCITCEPGPLSNVEKVCSAAWRTANGL
jgi:hypothetical protein